MQNSGRQTGDLSTVLVANEKNLVALATVLVAISSPETLSVHVMYCTVYEPHGFTLIKVELFIYR